MTTNPDRLSVCVCVLFQILLIKILLLSFCCGYIIITIKKTKIRLDINFYCKN